MKRTKDEIITSVTSILGDTPSDEGVALLEDIADSFDTIDTSEYENAIAEKDARIVELENEVERVANEWRTKYVNRFGEGSEAPKDDTNDDDIVDEITDDDIIDMFS